MSNDYEESKLGKIFDGMYKHVSSPHGCATCEVDASSVTCASIQARVDCGNTTCIMIVNTCRKDEHNQNRASAREIIKHSVSGKYYEAVLRDMSRPRIDGDSPDNGSTIGRFNGSPLPYVDSLEYHPVSDDLVCSYTDIVYRAVTQSQPKELSVFQIPLLGNAIIKSFYVGNPRHNCDKCVGDYRNEVCKALPRCHSNTVYVKVATDD